MLDAGDLKWAEVDITAEASPAVMDLSGTMGENWPAACLRAGLAGCPI